MRTTRLSGAVLIAVFSAACGGSTVSPAAPSTAGSTDITVTATIPPGPCTIGFDGLTANRAPFATHTACGLTVEATGAAWQGVTTYGVPPPFIWFLAPGGSTLTGDVTLRSAHDAFTFTSVDLYSSTTRIPYEVTGLAAGVEAFSLHDEVGNTFGNFKTVSNPHGTAIDTLRIRLTNPAAPCCENPVGLDNIRIAR